MTENLETKGYWTQAEVAEYFRVSPSTVKNWREKGYLPFFQLPGSTRVLYPDEGIRELNKRFTHTGKFTHTEKEVVSPKQLKRSEIQRKKPEISATTEKEWRI